MSRTELSSPAATPRRWLQFSLRTLLILTTFVAVWLAWWTLATAAAGQKY